MPIVLVEGCDGSGKSTLVERARGNQKDRYFIKAQAARYQPTIQHAFRYLAWLKQCPHDIVLDRLHFLSDRVYGPILRDEDVFKPLPLAFGLASIDAIVYCRPPTEKIKENVAKDRHLAGVADKIDEIIAGYDSIMKAIKEQKITRVYEYDYTQDDAAPFWNYVWSEVRRSA